MNELFARFRVSPSVRLRNQIIKHYYPLTEKVAWIGVRKRWGDFADLQSIAAEALIQAVERFDPDSGKPFEAYAIATMKGRILQQLRPYESSLDAPLTASSNFSLLDTISSPTAQAQRQYTTSTTEQVAIATALEKLPAKVRAIARWHYLDHPSPDADQFLCLPHNTRDRYLSEILDLLIILRTQDVVWFDAAAMTKWQDSDLILDLVQAAIADLQSQKQVITISSVARVAGIISGCLWLQPRSLKLIRNTQTGTDVVELVELAIQHHLSQDLELTQKAIARSANVPLFILKRHKSLCWKINRTANRRETERFKQKMRGELTAVRHTELDL